MTADEWRQKVAADRPPLSRAQLAVLRPIWADVTPHMNTAPACETEAASQESPMHRNTRGTA